MDEYSHVPSEYSSEYSFSGGNVGCKRCGATVTLDLVHIHDIFHDSLSQRLEILTIMAEESNMDAGVRKLYELRMSEFEVGKGETSQRH